MIFIEEFEEFKYFKFFGKQFEVGPRTNTALQVIFFTILYYHNIFFGKYCACDVSFTHFPTTCSF